MDIDWHQDSHKWFTFYFICDLFPISNQINYEVNGALSLSLSKYIWLLIINIVNFESLIMEYSQNQ